jgi:ABC-type multidrug transport system fused ATPase/permease subunit
MSDFREEEKLGKLYDTRLTHRLTKYLRPYAWLVFFAVLMSLAVAAMDILGPFLFGRGVDRFVVPGMHGDIERHAWRASRFSMFRCGSCNGSANRRCTTFAKRSSSTFSVCR